MFRLTLPRLTPLVLGSTAAVAFTSYRSFATSASNEAAGAAASADGDADDYSGAAYNPITGEINWDCPCLGGMAHGPCGEEFKEAFACFVYSETEPKGIDCIKKFEAMRLCFRQHPEHYQEQLDDEAAMEAADAPADAPAAPADTPAAPEAPEAAAPVKAAAPAETPAESAEPLAPAAPATPAAEAPETQAPETQVPETAAPES